MSRGLRAICGPSAARCSELFYRCQSKKLICETVQVATWQVFRYSMGLARAERLLSYSVNSVYSDSTRGRKTKVIKGSRTWQKAKPASNTCHWHVRLETDSHLMENSRLQAQQPSPLRMHEYAGAYCLFRLGSALVCGSHQQTDPLEATRER